MTGASNRRTFPQSVFDANAESYPAWRHRQPGPEHGVPVSCRCRPTFPVPDLTVAIVAASANARCGCPPPGIHSAAATLDSPARLRIPTAVPTYRSCPFGLSMIADSKRWAEFLDDTGLRRIASDTDLGFAGPIPQLRVCRRPRHDWRVHEVGRRSVWLGGRCTPGGRTSL